MAHKNAMVNIQLMKYSKEDSAVMRAIAEASQKDSFAMTVLSIMGMVFLPGAFVAVCILASIVSMVYRYAGLLINERVFLQCQYSIGMMLVSRV
jgi:hypothetical protein